MNCIPTEYKNVQFRSRLEATWAAYFDLLRWGWEYEPCDFKGWIPDFVLYGNTTVYVEVKPVSEFPLNIAQEIDRSGCTNEALIVGMSGILYIPGQLIIGWLRDIPDFNWEPASYGIWEGSEIDEKNPDKIIGFCHTTGSFRDRITGCYDGGTYGSGNIMRDDISNLWAEAKNLVQWKSPRPTRTLIM